MGWIGSSGGVVVGVVGRRRVVGGDRSRVAHQKSRLRTSRALVVMKFLRRLDVVAHQHAHDLVGQGGLLDVDLQQRARRRRSIVVARSSSQSISPRPFRRWNSFLWFGRSSRNAALAASSLRYTFSLPTSVEYSGGWAM